MDSNIWDEPAIQDSAKLAEDDDDVPHRPKKRPRQALFYADSDDDDIGNDPPPLTLHEILPSSSPAHDQERNIGEKGGENTKDEEKKVRRRQLKLDENLLLSPTGFPQLIKMTNDFRIKGKGHEAVDLDRLLRIYQYWTHQLYPKTTFTDTVERVEKLCHSRRMSVALSVWRDEAHGKFTNHVDNNEDSVETRDEDDQTQQRDDNTLASLAALSSSPVLNDEILPPTGDHIPGEDDDAEFWKTIDTGVVTSLSDIPSAPPTTGPNSIMDEDEDMWNIVNEVEEALSTAPASAEVAVASGPLPQGHIQDDDWDDMYV